MYTSHRGQFIHPLLGAKSASVRRWTSSMSMVRHHKLLSGWRQMWPRMDRRSKEFHYILWYMTTHQNLSTFHGSRYRLFLAKNYSNLTSWYNTRHLQTWIKHYWRMLWLRMPSRLRSLSLVVYQRYIPSSPISVLPSWWRCVVTYLRRPDSGQQRTALQLMQSRTLLLSGSDLHLNAAQ